MAHATFLIDPQLACFLARQKRAAAVSCNCARAATLKQAIEALGVPHTEIGSVTVNGTPATLARIVREGDLVSVEPHMLRRAPFEEPLAFIADAHLGGLARMLRMLGFDALFENAFDDADIADIAAREKRVVLTRDIALLKRRDVLRGCFVRALKPEAQLREIAVRYDIAERMRPFTLCLHCNVELAPAAAQAVAENVPPRIREHYSQFMHCARCRRIYWEGSHWDRMRAVLGAALEVPAGCIR